VNGFLVGDAGDVEKQKLFVEHPGDFIVAKHLPLKHRRSEAAAHRDGDRAGEQVEGRTAHQIKELCSETPDGGLCGFGYRLLGHDDDDRGCCSGDRTLQTMRVRTIRRGLHEPCEHLVRSEDGLSPDQFRWTQSEDAEGFVGLRFSSPNQRRHAVAGRNHRRPVMDRRRELS
jgi:hypothetical protein